MYIVSYYVTVISVSPHTYERNGSALLLLGTVGHYSVNSTTGSGDYFCRIYLRFIKTWQRTVHDSEIQIIGCKYYNYVGNVQNNNSCYVKCSYGSCTTVLRNLVSRISDICYITPSRCNINSYCTVKCILHSGIWHFRISSNLIGASHTVKQHATGHGFRYRQ
jgi:hypothetical protein